MDLAREASTSPGVYQMKDENGAILYVGKAKNLRNRLSQYFQPAERESPRTEMMVGRVSKFDVILTETEDEALLLECTLIKKHRPKFNVMLKDDKSYPYLKIRMDEDFPRIEYTRRAPQDGSRYFGPFPSGWSARQAMELLNDTFQLRDCSDNTFRHRSRPCILHQIGRCSGACVGLASKEQYQEAIREVIRVLEGKTDKLIGELKRGMTDASAREDYEEAARYRDQIQSLGIVTQTQGAVEAGSERARDVVGIAREGVVAHAAVMRVRNGKMVGVQHYHLQNTDAEISDAQLLFDFLAQYYVRERADPNEKPPHDVLVPAAPSEPFLLERVLGVGIRVPQTPQEEQMSAIARTNAEYALVQSLKRAAGHGVEALEEVQEKLHLMRLPQRIECFDISNTQGDESVASRVVFVDGAPDKNLYRRYKIKTVEGANDFASMREILGRRFANDPSMPDLVVVDGGKGQLAQAVAIFEELGVQGVGVVGLAKARTERDFKSSEVKSSMERVFIPGRKNPVPLLPHTAAYKLLTHVRDEAHRFAISYHRALRGKKSLLG